MTVTSNENYLKLLEKIKIIPKIIETESEYQEYLDFAENLTAKKEKRTPEENILFELMVKLIEDYEEKSYSLEDWGNLLPYEILQHLLESSGIEQADLARIIDSDEKSISDLVNGQLGMSQEQAEKLGIYFKVSPKLFSGTNLSGANRRGTNLSGVDLSGANLRGTDLIGAMLMWANLSRTNLHKAHLIGACLTSSDLIQADLTQADLSQAILNAANLSQANLCGANLTQANLCGANLNGANLSGANLSGANLSGADLSGADLSGADLKQTTVIMARFGGNKGIDPEQKEILSSNGAIFPDFPHDSSKVRISV